MAYRIEIQTVDGQYTLSCINFTIKDNTATFVEPNTIMDNNLSADFKIIPLDKIKSLDIQEFEDDLEQ